LLSVKKSNFHSSNEADFVKFLPARQNNFILFIYFALTTDAVSGASQYSNFAVLGLTQLIFIKKIRNVR
jgi:hypothetical protein